jgi:hypothetical protein
MTNGRRNSNGCKYEKRLGVRDEWRKIAISLIDPEKGEWKAQSCAIAGIAAAV